MTAGTATAATAGQDQAVAAARGSAAFACARLRSFSARLSSRAAIAALTGRAASRSASSGSREDGWA